MVEVYEAKVRAVKVCTGEVHLIQIDPLADGSDGPAANDGDSRLHIRACCPRWWLIAVLGRRPLLAGVLADECGEDFMIVGWSLGESRATRSSA